MKIPAAPLQIMYQVANNSLAALMWEKQNAQTLLRLCRMHRSSCKQQVMTYFKAMACTGTAVAQVSHHIQRNGKARVHCCNPICSVHQVSMISPCLLHAEKELCRCIPLLIPSCSFGHSIAQLLACKMFVLCIDKRDVAVQAATEKESCGAVQWKQLKLGGSVWCSYRANCRAQRPHLRAWTCSGMAHHCAALQLCLLQPGFIEIVQKNAA